MHNHKTAAAIFHEPMVAADFGYSTRGTLAALAVALGIASALYAFTLWPVQTVGWLALAGGLRVLGRHPIAALFK